MLLSEVDLSSEDKTFEMIINAVEDSQSVTFPKGRAILNSKKVRVTSSDFDASLALYILLINLAKKDCAYYIANVVRLLL